MVEHISVATLHGDSAFKRTIEVSGHFPVGAVLGDGVKVNVYKIRSLILYYIQYLL